MDIKDFDPINPETLRNRTESELLFIMTANIHGVWDSWAKAEIARRQNEQLGALIGTLTEATHRVREEVAILGSSSERLERLTLSLRNLTWVLIALTFLTIVEAVAVEWWKYHRESRGVETSPATAAWDWP